MKTTLLASLVGLVLCVGCLTPQEQSQFQDWTCDRAFEAYTAYTVAEAAGVVSDEDTIKAVRIAAAYLSAYCGWQQTNTVIVNRGFTRAVPTSDHNGVLLVHQP